ncbi:PH domain-containing protein [Gordonia polyisoprenivorans]|uniref:PH domain-containing protein n=1 Tax=Gordonia polyisoprenivorans TaxID=84595 RepID=UPI00035C245E|nr:PH domain-containing protein [Gordonia polyisoprenivorans]MBE7192173.1 PH domain-containing protein [Gordonia polyisoprenivorans]QUD82710.1 PH domain-containing protein [Gordonia polyisoprenivorans]UZF56456.1 PH domain-containing protein [Gordonia polyisoprenivorans]
MDNSAELSTQQWATPRLAAGALLAAGVVLLLCAVFVASDAVGSVIIGIAGLMLLGFGAYASLIRPRLELSAGPQLTIRRIGGAVTLTPADVERVRLLTMRRIGRRSGQLEIDYFPAAADHGTQREGTEREGTEREESMLVVFSRWDLGADLLDVVDALDRAGFAVEDSRR